MTPEAKATELVNKYYCKIIDTTKHKKAVTLKEAKEFALITIDEILQTNPTIKGTSEDLITMIVQTKAYWYRVQDCINAL